MDYLLENLGDERFQEFCQSLINKEFKNTQSLPVGQPDGGNIKEYTSPDDRIKIGAAEFMLSSEIQNNLEKVLLQGGPGQGKSTSMPRQSIF